MGQLAMYALAVFLACFGISQAAHIASKEVHYTSLTNEKVDGQDYIYKYSAVVTAGQNEPTPYASKFEIDGKFFYQMILDSSGNFKFYDVKHTLYNGPNDGQTGQFQFIGADVKDYEIPFGYHRENNNSLTLMVEEKDAVWSRNMKRSFVSLVSIPHFSRSRLEKSPVVMSINEVNNYGPCEVSYYVYRKEGQENLFVARKTYDPRSCKYYHKQIFFNNYNMKCQVEPEEDLVTVSEKVYEFEYMSETEIRVKKIISHEKLSYLPWSHRSFGVQYVETNQTIEFEKVTKRTSEISLKNPKNRQESSEILFDTNHYQRGINLFENTYKYFKEHTDEEKKTLMKKVKENLISMVDYLQENKGSVLDDNPEYKELFGSLHRGLQYLDAKHLNETFFQFKGESERGELARKILLNILPHTGTYATWEFIMTYLIKNLENDKFVLDKDEAVYLLQKLPMYVLNPTKEFAKFVSNNVKELVKIKSTSVTDAAVLAHSVLLDKTYKNLKLEKLDNDQRKKEFELFLDGEIKNYKEHIKSEPTYQSKILYILAMGNIQYDGIVNYLSQIIRGDYDFSVIVDIEKPEKFRVAAMWAISRSIADNKELIYETYWPIFSNKSHPQSLRLTAYEFLVSKNPTLDMNLLVNLHTFMETETDEHIFNYHYSTLKSMSETTDPCQKITSEMMRRMLRLTKKRNVMGRLLSVSEVFDYYDTKYDHGMMMKVAISINEDSGFPHFGFFEAYYSFARRPRHEDGVYWNVDGLNLNSMISLFNSLSGPDERNLTGHQILNEKVRNLLSQTKGHKKLDQHIHVEIWKMNKGYVTEVKTFFEAGLTAYITKCINDYLPKNFIDVGGKFNLDYLNIDFPNQYQMVALTDIGIPFRGFNEVPQMMYARLRPNIQPHRTGLKMQLELEGKFYHHSHYGMKFYNPFAKVTQLVRRQVTTHVILPFEINATFNVHTKDLKIDLPRNLNSRFSTAGFKIVSDDAVMIKNDEVISSSSLKTYCPACKDEEYIIPKDLVNKTNYKNVKQLNETGLEYSYEIHSCNDDRTINSEIDEWLRVLNTVRNPSDTVAWVEFAELMMDQALTNMLNDPYASSCKSIFKISPSTVYPTSKVEMIWRFRFTRILRDNVPELIASHLIPNVNVTYLTERSKDNFELTVQGSIDTKSEETNESRYSLDIDTSLIISEYYRHFRLNLKNKVSGKNNQNICLRAEKIYPIIKDTTNVDELNTNAALEVLFGNPESNSCNEKEDNGFSIFVKGELLDEQKEFLKNNVESGSSCFKNPTNLLDLDITKRFDWNCLYDAVKYSTLRKYTAQIMYNTLSDEIIAQFTTLINYFKMENLYYITYKPDHSNPKTSIVVASYDLNSNRFNLSMQNPYYTELLENIQYGLDDVEDKRNDNVLDNVLFGSQFLMDFYSGDIRPCVAHADEVINDLNQTVKMNFKEWTLLSGDHELMSWAVFVKSEDGQKVAMKMFFSDKELTVHSADDLKPIITMEASNSKINPRLIFSYLNSDRESTMKMVNQLLMVDLKSKVRVYYTPYNIIVIPQIMLDRNVDGVCGHMGSSSYSQDVQLIYT